MIRFGDGHVVDSARFSPDGRWVAFARRDDENWVGQALVAPANPSSLVARSDCIAISNQEHLALIPRWSADGRSLHFLSDRTGNLDIWQVALTADMRPRGQPRPVRTFDTTRISLASVAYEDLGFDIGAAASISHCGN